MTEPSIFARLANGEFDSQLEQLAAAVRDRRKYATTQQGLANKADMGPGTKVTVTGRISPKYLIGVTGTVSVLPARRAADVQVDIDEAYLDLCRRFGKSVGVPASCLTKTG
jgi:hypothetical protein